MIRALQTLRSNVRSDEMSEGVAQALVILDCAGVFAAIDRAGLACTCPADERAKSGTDNHYIECPQAPVCTCPRSRVTFPVPLGDDMHAQNCALVL